MLSFDDILTNRVKLGRGQFEQFLIMSMIDFIDGYQEIMMAILIAILTLQWNLSHTEVMFFGSSSFFGIMIGSFISSVVADRIGRRTVMAYGMFSTGVVIILQSVVVNYGEMILLRVLLGILFGISLPLSMVVVSEIVPTDVRGKFIVML
jgi:putative MFS transporter